MSEALSVPALLAQEGFAALMRQYGGFVALIPVIWIGCVVLLVRSNVPPAWRFAAVFALFGSALLCFQVRLHYYGSAALLLAPLLALQYALDRLPRGRARAVGLAAAVAMAGAAQPGFARLGVPVAIGGSFDYMYTRALYPVLAESCAALPGIVLADNNDGHYIRYHTDCAVISDNFILTPQHEQKLLLTDRLLALPAERIVRDHPEVTYLLVRREDDVTAPSPPDEVRRQNQGLRAELLLDDAPWPPELHLLLQILVRTGDGREVVLARAYRIDRGAAARPERSVAP